MGNDSRLYKIRQLYTHLTFTTISSRSEVPIGEYTGGDSDKSIKWKAVLISPMDMQ